MTNQWAIAAAVSASLTAVAGAALAQRQAGAEHDAIAYSKSRPTDRVARLQERIDAGAVTLAFDPRHGYLPAVLKALDIPVSSQGLVFSKTSLQLDRIAPWSPRALYFSDDVYVGWVQGGPILEIASVDPRLGSVFYSLPQQPAGKPRLEREGATCLVCHDSPAITGGVPGLIVRSVLTDRHGYTIGTVHDGATTDRTPIASRWGGWYATGSVGQHHVANLMAPALAHEVGDAKRYIAKATAPPAQHTVGDSLDDRFDVEPYLSRHSDVVALMVLTHQAQVHNLITSANYEARKALRDEGRDADDTASDAYGEATLRRVAASAEPLVRAMLFAREAPLEAPVKGSSTFAAEFVARGPRDERGRSLRDLDLERRLFAYPLSYLVYSESFDALPGVVKTYVYRRFREVLGGTDTSITHLSAADRQAIREILDATKPDFAAARP